MSKYVVGVSGGADSMALLDMCYQNKIEVVVAHVDYNKRKTSERDAICVEKYCNQHGIIFEKKIINEYPKNGNFQKIARDMRYQFYLDLIKKYDCDKVLIAHHLDDLIETFIMQKNRKTRPNYYGINSESIVNGCLVYRPLLKYRKKELEQYCISHNVEFHTDESNLKDDYTRNYIRHHVLKDLNYDECIIEINNLNLKISKLKDKYKNLLIDEMFKIGDLLKLEKEDLYYVLRWYLNDYKIFNLSEQKFEEIYCLLLKSNKFKINFDDYDLIIEYGYMYLLEKETKNFSYTLNELEYIETPFFTLNSTGKLIESVNIKKSDFPITIRNYQLKDEIKLRYGTKKVNRFLIDRKILTKYRKKWPVIVNSSGKVIFVCGIGCDIEHFSNNSNLFVIK